MEDANYLSVIHVLVGFQLLELNYVFLIIKGPKQAYVRFTSKAGYTYMHKELKLFQWSSLADFKWIAYAIYSHNLIPILQFLQYQMNRIPDFSLYRHWNLTI